MATILLPPDFNEFLRLLNARNVEYLLVGGYAVDPINAEKLAQMLREFGFPQASGQLFQEREKIIRMGVPPIRIQVLTSVSGVDFAACFPNLKANKKASGRLKDLADLEQRN